MQWWWPLSFPGLASLGQAICWILIKIPTSPSSALCGRLGKERRGLTSKLMFEQLTDPDWQVKTRKEEAAGLILFTPERPLRSSLVWDWGFCCCCHYHSITCPYPGGYGHPFNNHSGFRSQYSKPSLQSLCTEGEFILTCGLEGGKSTVNQAINLRLVILPWKPLCLSQETGLNKLIKHHLVSCRTFLSSWCSENLMLLLVFHTSQKDGEA